MNHQKALATAKEWIPDALRYAISDCSDSMHEAEKLENRFNALVDDSITIEEFVKKHLYTEYLEGCKNMFFESGYDHSNWRSDFGDTPTELPIPFYKIEHDLAKLFPNG